MSGSYEEHLALLRAAQQADALQWLHNAGFLGTVAFGTGQVAGPAVMQQLINNFNAREQDPARVRHPQIDPTIPKPWNAVHFLSPLTPEQLEQIRQLLNGRQICGPQNKGMENNSAKKEGDVEYWSGENNKAEKTSLKTEPKVAAKPSLRQ